jgi:hypothetical protein
VSIGEAADLFGVGISAVKDAKAVAESGDAQAKNLPAFLGRFPIETPREITQNAVISSTPPNSTLPTSGKKFKHVRLQPCDPAQAIGRTCAATLHVYINMMLTLRPSALLGGGKPQNPQY